MQKVQKLIKNLGPGLLFAGMSIGTSHLVLSTKAGAKYGWFMIIPILLANILKYPFFEFGIRYTNASGKNIIEGYRNRGKIYFRLFVCITLVTTVTSPAALCAITAGMAINMINLDGVPILGVAIGLLTFNSFVLILGKYKLLVRLLKFLIPMLFIGLLVSIILVVNKGIVTPIVNFRQPQIFDDVGILFIITLIGWMPTGVETSSWLSLWTTEKYTSNGVKPTLSSALREFNFNYLLTTILALLFFVIGYMTLYGSGVELSESSVVFAHQLVSLFTSHLGNWAYIVISVSAFATIYSTLLTCHDATTRVSIAIISLMIGRDNMFEDGRYYMVGVIFLAFLGAFVLYTLDTNMGTLLASATVISFVFAPLLGYMNLKNVMSEDLIETCRPKLGLQLLSIAGILFLLSISIYYAWLIFK